MDTLVSSNFSSTIKTYVQLTKPGIIGGNAITAFGGFALASQAGMDVQLLLTTLLGLCLIMASGCVSNNYLDRHSDKKMVRTETRGLVTGAITLNAAKIFSAILCLIGTLLLALFTNPLTVSIALFGLFVYVVLYSTLKYRSVHATLIGSVAGAVPPVVGYCAVSNHFDLGAFLLFAVLVCWQMPHFYAIAIYRLKDYTAALIPVLPVKKGLPTTKIQMLLYTLAFIGASTALFLCNDMGPLYLATSTLLGTAWLALCVQGFKAQNDTLWARKMFIVSLVVITALSVVIPFS